MILFFAMLGIISCIIGIVTFISKVCCWKYSIETDIESMRNFKANYYNHYERIRERLRALEENNNEKQV